MADVQKLDRWADKLLDTGKRNNLINFKDTKASSAEIVFPDCEAVFSKCSVGRVFELFEPKTIYDDGSEDDDQPALIEDEKLSREEYLERCIPKMKSDHKLLAYAQTLNPLTAVKNIAKKAKLMQDETGLSVAYLAFGFVKWNEKDDSRLYYRAPLLLVHINIITGSVLDPVRIEISDDDVVVNPTFSYFLQAEYGFSLPEYEDGETLQAYYAKVSSLLDNLGWVVLNECKLGIFSFLKINMYEDLKNNAEQIMNNPIIQALLGEGTADTVCGGELHPVTNPLVDLHTVVDADSSQIEAIEMAKSGKSFVLQGPPGTGKSQTITNIIAECLYDGKKVLFVSEKQAALNVVFDKLKKAGLADFCLELHSHKANKRAVIDELNRTLTMPKSAVSDGVQEEIRQKTEAQKKLDSYADALHKKREPVGKSLYQLLELYSAERDYPDVDVIVRDIQSKGKDHLDSAVKLLEQYAEYTPYIGSDYRLNAWYGFTDLNISFEARNQLKADLELLLNGYRDLESATASIRDKYETPELNYSYTRLWQAMLSFTADSDVVTPMLLSRDRLDRALPVFASLKEQSEMIAPIKARVLQSFDAQSIDCFDGKEIYNELTNRFRSPISRMFNGEYKQLTSDLKLHSAIGKKPGYKKAVEFAENLVKLQAALSEYKKTEATVCGSLGACYDGPETDWFHVMSAMESLNVLLTDNNPTFGAIAEMTAAQFADKKEEFRKDANILAERTAAIDQAKLRVSQQFNSEVFDLEENSYGRCIQKIEDCLNNFDKLGNWISFAELLRELQSLGLREYIEKIIEGHVDPSMAARSYRKVFCKHWIENILFTVPELSNFTRITQDQAVHSFQDKDKLQYEISKSQIKSKLSQLRPNLDIVAGGSAVSVLRREGQKKRKQMPIRKLMSETGNLVQLIKPCFLMSPLSVSTFLEPEKISFDTVVFDEASQIFPQDAVGAVYRGKQLIVVGDSKQMPPSNFFNSSLDVDDDEETADVNDFESILDICSSVFTTERLAWHYRSHYEQLIAFSNYNFYSNGLVTFPSATTDREGVGVDYYHVNGVFDRKSKTNRAEAEFIVDLIYKHIEKYPKRSLGVVAFSVAQQNMIDKLLSKRRENDPSREDFFKSDCAEPFFIKNLETVQGDERDTIIFSVAYAKDSQGRFIHNFGPLNREGGERRLNVAVTRAKENVQLVASIYYSDINLNNSGSEGVRLLRAYLDFAQNGEQALERAVTDVGDERFDSFFEQEVCDFLRDNGFSVDTQVGCSGYRIDLALKRPDSSDYLLAIECDGASYHNSKNARDRDSLRQQILENMGWKFYRIWSTDWYRNTAAEKQRLLQVAGDAVLKAGVSENSPEASAQEVEDAEQLIQEEYVEQINESGCEFPEYKQVDAFHIVHEYTILNLQRAVKQILETEAPLSEEYLLKRIVGAFGQEKVTSNVRDTFGFLMGKCSDVGIIRKNGFMYLEGMGEIKLRVPGDKREIKYISLEELADGLYTLILQNVSVSKDGLYKLLTNRLGFNRTGNAIFSRYDSALDMLIKSGKVTDSNGLLSIKQN